MHAWVKNLRWTQEQLKRARRGKLTAVDIDTSIFPMPTTVAVWCERVAEFQNEKHMIIQLYRESLDAMKIAIEASPDEW